MKYCKTCHVHYQTDLNHCILCNGELEKTDDQPEVFNFTVCKKRSVSRFFYRLFVFMNIVSAIVSIYLQFKGFAEMG